MKTLHSMMIKSISYNSGIFNQMNTELKSAKELKLNHKVTLFLGHVEKIEENSYGDLVNSYKLKSTTRLGRFIEHRKAYYSWLKSNEDEVDCFILRYSIADPLQYYFIRNCSKPVLLIHHTKELDEMKLNGLKGKALGFIDSIFGNLSIRQSDAIIGVTNEIIDYEKARIKEPYKKSILYPNGIFISDNQDFKLIDRRSLKKPEVLFIASYFYEWHGLDILIDKINSSNIDILIHVVGKVSESDYNKLKANSRFQLHGSLDKQQIANLASQCWISLGSLALYRKNMEEACTLKVRESLSLGLPVYSAHKDIFPDNFIFYKNAELSAESLYEYAISMRKMSKDLVRESSKEYISKSTTLKRFHSELLHLFSG